MKTFAGLIIVLLASYGLVSICEDVAAERSVVAPPIIDPVAVDAMQIRVFVRDLQRMASWTNSNFLGDPQYIVVYPETSSMLLCVHSKTTGTNTMLRVIFEDLQPAQSRSPKGEVRFVLKDCGTPDEKTFY